MQTKCLLHGARQALLRHANFSTRVYLALSVTCTVTDVRPDAHNLTAVKKSYFHTNFRALFIYYL